jgi:hypothetical protein
MTLRSLVERQLLTWTPTTIVLGPAGRARAGYRLTLTPAAEAWLAQQTPNLVTQETIRYA